MTLHFITVHYIILYYITLHCLYYITFVVLYGIAGAAILVVLAWALFRFTYNPPRRPFSSGDEDEPPDLT